MKHAINWELKRLFYKPFHPQRNAKIENVHNFIKWTPTKFLESSDLEWDELLPITCYCYNLFLSSNNTESQLFLMFRWIPAEGCLTHHNNNRYYGTNKGKIILEQLHKLWKDHSAHLIELHQRKEYTHQQINKNNTKFEISQAVKVKYHACHSFEPKYLLDYKVLKMINDSTLLVIVPYGNEWKTNFNYAKPCSTTEPVDNVWDSFLGSIKTIHQNYTYNLRP